MVPWNAARTKVQIKLTIQRLRTLQEKKSVMAKKTRRDIADLLLKNRVETARLRVEGLIQDDIYVELLELLELYLEMLQARFNLLDASTGQEPDPSISDAVCAIIYAAPRTELKELQVLREILMHKFGRPFALSLQPSNPPPSSVPPRITSKLALYTPGRELVDAYLYEIAKGYGVNWAPDPPALERKQDDADGVKDVKGKAKDESGEDGGNGEDDDGPGEGQNLEPALLADPGGKGKKVDDASVGRVDGAISDVPTYPAGQEKDAWAGGQRVSHVIEEKGSEEEELAKRFERLKNLK